MSQTARDKSYAFCYEALHWKLGKCYGEGGLVHAVAAAIGGHSLLPGDRPRRRTNCIIERLY